METNVQRNVQVDEFYLYLQKEGQSMIPLEGEDCYRPFPGLRPFRTTESHLFFGRTRLVTDLLERMRRSLDESLPKMEEITSTTKAKPTKTSRFLAIVGDSGSGKSSLVRAGLLPALHSGDLKKLSIHWNVAVCRPGDNPLGNLALALSIAFNQESDKIGTEIPSSFDKVQDFLRESAYGIIDVVEDQQEQIQSNLLIVIDQFEELFRFKREGDSQQNFQDSILFVRLLIEASRQSLHPIFVILTMRSEFIGDCTQFQDLADAINKGLYLVPKLIPDEQRSAIVGPLAVFNVSITESLVNRLLKEIGDGIDQLPILQHALMRTYNAWAVKDKAGTFIDHIHYDQIGTMEKALDLHANEVMLQFDEREKGLVKLLYQCITDKSGNKETRRPQTVGQILPFFLTYEGSFEDLEKIVDAFRHTDVSFLQPPQYVSLKDYTIVDISHESLMRIWVDLKTWVEEEALNGRTYKRLIDKYLEGEKLVQPQLDLVYDWYTNKKKPDVLWASRYHRKRKGSESDATFFTKVESYISESFVFYQKEKEKEEKEKEENEDRLRRLRYNKRVIIVLVVLLVLGGVGIGYFLDFTLKKEKDALQAEEAAYTAKQQALKAEKEASVQTNRATIAEQRAKESKDSALLYERSSKEAIRLAKQSEFYARQAKIEEQKARDSSIWARNALVKKERQFKSDLINGYKEKVEHLMLSADLNRESHNTRLEYFLLKSAYRISNKHPALDSMKRQVGNKIVAFYNRPNDSLVNIYYNFPNEIDIMQMSYDKKEFAVCHGGLLEIISTSLFDKKTYTLNKLNFRVNDGGKTERPLQSPMVYAMNFRRGSNDLILIIKEAPYQIRSGKIVYYNSHDNTFELANGYLKSSSTYLGSVLISDNFLAHFDLKSVSIFDLNQRELSSFPCKSCYGELSPSGRYLLYSVDFKKMYLRDLMSGAIKKINHSLSSISFLSDTVFISSYRKSLYRIGREGDERTIAKLDIDNTIYTPFETLDNEYFGLFNVEYKEIIIYKSKTLTKYAKITPFFPFSSIHLTNDGNILLADKNTIYSIPFKERLKLSTVDQVVEKIEKENVLGVFWRFSDKEKAQYDIVD